MEPLKLKSQMLLPSRPPTVIWIASRTKTYNLNTLKIKLTLIINAHAGNALHCSDAFLALPQKVYIHTIKILGK
jgi:hypothetical protein